MSRTSETLPWAPPSDDIRVETPDGVNYTSGSQVRNNLYDNGGKHPNIQSGDWQVEPQGYAPSNKGTTQLKQGR